MWFGPGSSGGPWVAPRWCVRTYSRCNQLFVETTGLAGFGPSWAGRRSPFGDRLTRRRTSDSDCCRGIFPVLALARCAEAALLRLWSGDGRDAPSRRTPPFRTLSSLPPYRCRPGSLLERRKEFGKSGGRSGGIYAHKSAVLQTLTGAPLGHICRWGSRMAVSPTAWIPGLRNDSCKLLPAAARAWASQECSVGSETLEFH